MNSFLRCGCGVRVVTSYGRGHQLQPQADLFFIAINVTARVWLLPSGNAPDGKPSLLRLDLESSSVRFSP